MPSLNYFSQYPKSIYTRPSYSLTPITGSNGKPLPYTVTLTDILTRFDISSTALGDTTLFYPYQWTDSDRPDLLGLQYYGSINYFWLVMYSAGAIDVDYDFPLANDTFMAFLAQKYQIAVAAANSYTLAQFLALPQTTIYTLTIAYLNSTVNTYILYFVDNPTNIFNINATQYAYYGIGGNYNAVAVPQAAALGVTLPAAVVGIITQYQYEYDLNESKRAVNLLDNDYTRQIAAEFAGDMAALVSAQNQIGDI